MDEGNEAFDRPAAIASLPDLYAARDLAGLARVLVRLDWVLGRIYPWDDDYVLFVRSIPTDDIVELIHLIAREVREAGADRPAALLWELSLRLPDEVLPEVCADWLAGADRRDDSHGVAWAGETARMAAACLASGIPVSPGVVAAIRRMASHPAWSGKGPLTELI